jgi:arylformamidase
MASWYCSQTLSQPNTLNRHTMIQPKTSAWYDSQYNNRALVPEFASHFANWTDKSAAARVGQQCLLDIPYGLDRASPLAATETLDIFPAAGHEPARAAAAPVMVFLHGGYWRSLDKSDHSFIAPAFTQTGACVVVPNYALCPGTAQAPVTVPTITLQMAHAVAWVYRHIGQYGGDASRITVVGHSAGGHLTAMMLACAWQSLAADLPAQLIKNALSISGLHELDSIRKTPFLQASLKLTPTHVKKASPAWLPAPRVTQGRGQLISVAGGNESPEFLRQNQLIQSAWGRRVVPTVEALPGLNHFSVLEALADPAQRLHQLARGLLGL